MKQVRAKKIVLPVGIFLIILVILSTVFLFQQRTAAVTVDFASRQNKTYPIPPNMFGTNGGGSVPAHFAQFPGYLQSGGFRTFRLGIDMSGQFPTVQSFTDLMQQNWTSVDAELQILQASHIQPIITLGNSPTWLQPYPNPCSLYPNALPQATLPSLIDTYGQDIGPPIWAKLAQAVVAHIDTTFPLLVPYYEIWNEPNFPDAFCLLRNPGPTDPIRVNTYIALYQAVAPLMKQQAQTDHVQIKIGGPVIGEVQASENVIDAFFPSFLNNPALAPYIDFVSYHDYFFGDGWSSLLARTQDSQHGLAAKYKKVAAYVLSGKQHNASSTPIFIDEYNNSALSSNSGCCRNDFTYAPMWNSLVIADMLNATLATTSPLPTKSVIPHLNYYMISDPTGQFCLFGVIDVAMDCANSGSVEPYPQFYSYLLASSQQYLDMDNHGYLVSPVTVQPGGMTAVGFYTQTKDDLLLVNTSSSAYPQLTIAIQNPGLIQAVGNVYTLNSANPHIASQRIPLTSTGQGYTATVNVPAYSTVALSLGAN